MKLWGRLLALSVALGACALCLPTATTAQDRDSAHKELIGKPAFDMKTGFTLNGKQVTMEDLRGKVVLLDFWAVWCGPCVATFPHLRDWHKKYNKKGLEIVGVTQFYRRFDFENGKVKQATTPLSTSEEEAMLEKFVKHHKLKHRIVAMQDDDANDLKKYYRVSGIPQVVLINRDGNIRLIKVGATEAAAKAIEAEIKKLVS